MFPCLLQHQLPIGTNKLESIHMVYAEATFFYRSYYKMARALLHIQI